MKKRILSLFLALVMVCSLLPTVALAADPTPVAVKLHGKNIKGYVGNGSQTIEAWSNAAARTATLQNAYDTVYLGGKAYYVLSMNGSSDNYTYYAEKNPDGIHTTATYADDAGTAVAAENAIFLLSDANLGNSQFYSANTADHYWSKHTAGSLWDKLNGTAETAYINTLFSDAERAAILKTYKNDVKVVTLATDGYNENWSGTFNQTWSDNSTDPATTRRSSDLLGDKLYPLSISEIVNPAYGLNTRQANRTYGAAANWWLRSSGSTDKVGHVNSAGGFYSYDATHSIAVRPALNLNLTSVLFASDAAAGSGKSNASEASVFTNFLASDETNQWKLTLTDSTKTLANATLLKNGTNYSVVYSGASTGANTWLSAIIVDKTTGNILHYGKLKALTAETDAAGQTAAFQMPGGVTLGSNTVMQVFVETVAESQTGTDYASPVKEFTAAETVESIAVSGATTTYTAGETFVTEGVTVTATLSGSGTLSLPGWSFDYPNYVNKANDQKFHIDASESENQTVKIKSGFVNALSQPVTYDLAVTVNGIGKTDTPTLSLSKNADDTWKITVSGLSDGVIAEYSTDSGSTWTEVGTALDSIAAPDADVTYQVRPKADVANDRATGTVASIVVPAATATLYKVDVTVSKDGAAWADNTQRIDLRDASGNNYYSYASGASIVKPGTYDVYAINYDGEMVLVQSSLNVNADAACTVDYYSLSFAKNLGEGEVVTPVIVLKNTDYAPTAEITAATEGGAGLGLTFAGYKLSDGTQTIDGSTTPSTGAVIAAKSYKAQYTVNSITDNAACSVTEILGGQNLVKPEDTSIVIGGYTVDAVWSIYGGTSFGTAATTGVPYSYVATFTAPDGYTFEDKAWGTGWLRTNNTTLERTFDQIVAGYPVTVTGIPADITSLTYTVGLVTKTLAVSGSTAVFAAPNNELYENASIRTSDGVLYVGDINVRGGSATVALGTDLEQQAPVITAMAPNDKGTGVATATENIVLTFDQAVTVSGETLTMYQFASDAARQANQYVNSFVITLTADMLSADGKTLTLPVAAFLNGATAMTFANNNFYALEVPADAFTAKLGGTLKTAAFTDYLKASTTADLAVVTYSLSNPANGVLYASNPAGVVTASAAGSVKTGTAYAGQTVTFTAAANVGYKLSGYRITWDGTRYDITVGGTVPAALNGIVTLSGETMSVVTSGTVTAFTVEAVFAVDSAVTYTLTPVETAKTVAVGKTYTPEYTLSPSGAKIAFSSSDASVASVNASGVITGVKAGTAAIYAKAPTGALLCTWTITVIAQDSAVPTITTGEATNISVNGATLSGTFAANGLTILEAGVYVNGKAVKMSTIPADGKVSVAVTGLAAGTQYAYSVYVVTPTATYYDLNRGKTTEMKFTTKENTVTVSGGGGGGGASSAQIQKIVDEALAKQNEAKLPFTDVAKSAYYYDSVLWAYANDITEGTTETTFTPYSTVTRAQIVTFLWRAAGCPTPSKTNVNFTDIDKNEYYYIALQWALDKGITVGTSEMTFSPADTCTNAQIITMIWRAMNGSVGANSSAENYYDAAIKWAGSNKLLDGTYTGTFDVNAGTPRCNVVEYLYRYFVK